MTTTDVTPTVKLGWLAREIADYLEINQLPARSIYLDPGLEGILPTRGYVRVGNQSDLDRWASVRGVQVQIEPGPLPEQTQEYAEWEAWSDEENCIIRVYLVRRATDAEVAAR